MRSELKLVLVNDSSKSKYVSVTDPRLSYEIWDDIKGLGYHVQFSNTGTSTKEFTDDRSVNETNQATVG